MFRNIPDKNNPILSTRCHTSYVTKYEPHQEEACEDHFRKECLIDYEKKSIEELVEYCVTPMVKDCDIEGEEECQIVYQSECYTRQKVHEVLSYNILKYIHTILQGRGSSPQL